MSHLNCVYCGGSGIYVPIGQAGRACGFCDGTGVGHPSQFAENHPKDAKQAPQDASNEAVTIGFMALLAAGIAIAAIVEVTR